MHIDTSSKQLDNGEGYVVTRKPKQRIPARLQSSCVGTKDIRRSSIERGFVCLGKFSASSWQALGMHGQKHAKISKNCPLRFQNRAPGRPKSSPEPSKRLFLKTSDLRRLLEGSRGSCGRSRPNSARPQKFCDRR